MNIYVARHGESTHNLQGLHSANPRANIKLTEEGIRQARQLASKLNSQPIEKIYSSEFLRTVQTAEIISQKINVAVSIDPLLNELKTGFEDRPVDEWLAALKISEKPTEAKFNGGESLADGYERTQKFVQKMRQKRHHDVVVIAHGFQVAALSAIANGKGVEALLLDDDAGSNMPQGEYRLLSFS